MKTVLSGLVWVVLVSVVPARAVQAQAATDGQVHAQQTRVDKAIETQQASVRQLQGDVKKQESRTQQADEKLKQQDQQIADLQRQLKAMQAAPKGNGHP